MSHFAPRRLRKIGCRVALLTVLLSLLLALPAQAAPLQQTPTVKDLVLPLRELKGLKLPPVLASQNLVYNFTFNRASPNVLALEENLTVKFSYKTNRAGGVRIFVRPMTGGSTTTGYAAHGSPVYATGSGTGEGYFTIKNPAAVVDQVRVEMLAATGDTLLFRTYLPVHYAFRPATNLVSNISFSPKSPTLLSLNERVNITFSYRTNHAGGVRIWSLPFSRGAPTPSFGVAGSILHPTGSGTGTSFVTISSGPIAVVDQIRIQMWTDGETQLLFEAFLPVHFDFRSPANRVRDISLTPATPNALDFDQRVEIKFNYSAGQPGGVYIWARPMSGGAETPNYAAHGSPLYATGDGSGTGFFTIKSGSKVVDRVRFEIYGQDKTTLLFRAEIPVSYQYGSTR